MLAASRYKGSIARISVAVDSRLPSQVPITEFNQFSCRGPTVNVADSASQTSPVPSANCLFQRRENTVYRGCIYTQNRNPTANKTREGVMVLRMAISLESHRKVARHGGSSQASPRIGPSLSQNGLRSLPHYKLGLIHGQSSSFAVMRCRSAAANGREELPVST
jgi:hypothetical protein